MYPKLGRVIGLRNMLQDISPAKSEVFAGGASAAAESLDYACFIVFDIMFS